MSTSNSQASEDLNDVLIGRNSSAGIRSSMSSSQAITGGQSSEENLNVIRITIRLEVSFAKLKLLFLSIFLFIEL